MKLRNLLIMGTLSALAFTGCKDNDDNSVWGENEAIIFNSQISGMQTKASATAWSDGDEVGIFMQTATEEFANKKYLAQANGLLHAAPDNELRYPSEGTSSFQAYYPYTTHLNGKIVEISVADQSQPEKIDFLYSNNASNIANGKMVNLVFSHQLSQIIIQITKDETIASLNGLKVTLNGMNTQATFNLADGKLTATDSKAAIHLGLNTDCSLAKAIILPTQAIADAKLIFNLNDQNYECPLNTDFEPGCKYTFHANLSTQNGKPGIEMGNATITDWTDKVGGDINVDFGESGSGEQPNVEQVLLDETFDKDQGLFTIENLVLPEGSSYVWKWNEYTNNHTQYMKASAFINNANKVADSWLISPAVDLIQTESATLTFEHCHKFGVNKTQEMTLWLADAGTQANTAATGWTEISIPTYGTGNDYNYATATIDLKAYIGRKIQFAFRYRSTEAAAPIWQINEVKVVANGQGNNL